MLYLIDDDDNISPSCLVNIIAVTMMLNGLKDLSFGVSTNLGSASVYK